MRKRSRWFLGFLVATGLLATGAVATADAGRAVTLTARLEGAQEVPPADRDAMGNAVIKIDVNAGTVCFDATFDRVGTPNRGHIHKAPAGENGPIVVPFFELRPGDAPVTDPRHDALERGRLKDCVTADPALLADIVAHPELYYVNLHNTRYPGGAFRCQLDR
jgi:CHRD domain